MPLLGPDGKPIGTSNYKKAPAPALGPAFGDWAGRDVVFNQAPGGAILQFDLESLTLADYRAMRNHPQINASLTLLMFMLHQMDWWIESDDARARDIVERNMRDIWTRFIRAMSQALWAGYSPNVLEYENDAQNNAIVVSKVKDLHPEEAMVHWKEVEGYAPPGAVPPKFKIYDGIDQIGHFLGGQVRSDGTFVATVKGGRRHIPVENTFWYPLLMENGNYYGRKILKAAFAPWYFSTLVHLFANRYYERFGEPVPVGRANFDDTHDVEGKTMTGKEIMETILRSLRNRSVVVLPSDRDPVTKDYDYSLEYLESQMRGADFERYLSRLDEEISLAIFTPMLLMRTGDVGSHNLGVQHTQCVHPDTRILGADLRWHRAGDLFQGQEIIAFDDEPSHAGRGVNARCIRTAYVEWNIPSEKHCWKISTDLTKDVIASTDHPWLVWRRRKRSIDGNANFGLTWVETKDLVIGDKIAHFVSPWTDDDTRDGGWLSGMFDGEGSLTRVGGERSPDGWNGIELVVCQNSGPVLDKLKQTLTDKGFAFTDSMPAPTGWGSGNVHRLRIAGGMREAMRLVGTLRPLRFLEKAEVLWEGFGLRQNRTFDLALVTHLEDVGIQPVASLQTSTRTFIAEGLAAHNTWLWMLNALAGDLKEYIDRYICERLKAINISPNAPRVQWVFRPMGKENTETIRAIIQALLSKNKATVDLDELGRYLGMTVKEVRVVQGDDPEGGGDGGTGDEPRDRPRSSGPRGVGEPLATGREISNRVRSQVERAWTTGGFSSLRPDFGYRKRLMQAWRLEGHDHATAAQLTEQVFTELETFFTEATGLGADSYSGPQDFMSLFDRAVDNAISNAARQ